MPPILDLTLRKWRVRNADGKIDIPANVPGEIHTDLMRSGHIQGDPYHRDAYQTLRWIGMEDWTYSTDFPSNLSSQHIYLVFDGLDTIATISLNGKVVGKTENQFRRFIFDIRRLILEDAGAINTLSVTFASAAKTATTTAKAYPYQVPDGFDPTQNGERNRNFVRKEQCSFGWDWGPCFLPCGIWKSAKLVYLDQTALWITDAAVDIFPAGKDFGIKVKVDYRTALSGSTIVVDVHVDGLENLERVAETQDADTVELHYKVPASAVTLWWPAGYGAQKLYDLRISLKSSNGNTEDEVHKKIGFRTVELVQQPYPSQEGLSFYFRINSIPIFSKGTNWIPADAFESRVTTTLLRRLLQSCVEANMNMVRVWGGGIYQQDAFYEICDEMGLMVWQEFMFACAMYPVDKAFLENVREEAGYQVRRLMAHPCIVLWSGNNENEEALITGWYEPIKKNKFVYTIDYHRLYHETIMPTVKQIDPTRPFISSSPYNGIISEDPFTERFLADNGNPDAFGDVHYYNYKDDGTDVSRMRKPRFASEYGFQALPSFATFRKVTTEADWHPLSPLMVLRNHHPKGQEEIILQMDYHFKRPFSGSGTSVSVLEFDHFCYLSQCVQAICMKAQTEHYRRLTSLPANCMGALYWQCNDIWQAPTWAGIEYGGTWKMLHFFAKEFFERVLVSVYENTAENGRVEVWVVNDLLERVEGRLVVEFRPWMSTTADEIHRIEMTVKVDPQSSSRVAAYANVEDLITTIAPNSTADSGFLHFSLTHYETSTTAVYFPTSFTHVTLPNPNLRFSAPECKALRNGLVELSITVDHPAPFVWLEIEDEEGRFDRNGFVAIPGRNVVNFRAWEELKGDVVCVSVRSLYQAQEKRPPVSLEVSVTTA
ncbi:mannosidase, beta A, lysosomal-like protein [Fimicolochytrium jonesii]|uniref:mannosidase, beta A, lysosomal-like protein n=1 Tax=Fimicolochytrium jonesii TaxID=1396493 RepID=UPI0022FF33F9|nr:mannosidase, beta A, lysosomal-like protein [Fimicolochytrium jonesii]KAI8816810.1 mannosidase, beta A, lysosomal-like protein [Fimicolochytrium jonesii]